MSPQAFVISLYGIIDLPFRARQITQINGTFRSVLSQAGNRMVSEMLRTEVQKHRQSLSTLWLWLSVVIALTALLTACLSPIADIDTWWHLATGRYLVEAKSFLSADPFGLAGVDISPGRETALNAYWLSQVAFYSIFQVFGLVGIVALRVVLLLVPFLTVLAYGWRQSAHSSAVLCLSLLCGWAMIYIDGIRPNHLTVVCVPLLFILLAEIGYAGEWEEDGKYNYRKAWILPFFILVWANLHGGFMLGITVVLLYAVGETVTLRIRKQSLMPVIKIWGMVFCSILCSLLTPNGVKSYLHYFNLQGGAISSTEYLSPLALARAGIIYWPFLIVLLLCFFVFVVRGRNIPFTRLLLLLAMTVLGLLAFRYAPLFVGSAVILLLPEIKNIEGSSRRWHTMFGISSAALTCTIVLFAFLWFPDKAGALSQGLVNVSRFPVDATAFIKRNQLGGVVFNHWNWGGYLEWHQPSGLKTFVDGRNLNQPLLHAYTRVLWLPEEAQLHLDRYGVDLLIVPRSNPSTGKVYALTNFLWRKKEWDLVYQDRVGMVFVRQGLFSHVARLPKSMIYQGFKDVKKTFPPQS